ncbi:MAG: two-component regulator propeller domain-containing protein, partial [Bacteroidota bacterium]
MCAAARVQRLACLAFLGVLVGWGALGNDSVAQETRYAHYSMAEGLSNFSVTALAQDDHGFVWAGTTNGLSRFDGHRFSGVGRASGLSDVFVSPNALLAHRGVLWIGTRSGGLNRLDLATGQIVHFRHDPADPASLSHDLVTGLAAGPDGVLWIGTRRGLDRLDLRTGRLERITDPLDANHQRYSGFVAALAVDADGQVWVGTRETLSRYDPGTNRFVPVPAPWYQPASLGGNTGISVSTLHLGASGTLWVGTQRQGVLGLRPGATLLERVVSAAQGMPEAPVQAILEDRAGTLHVGLVQAGLCTLRPETDRPVCQRHRLDDAQGLSSNTIMGLMETPGGTLFVGTMNGLNKARSSKPFHAMLYDPQAPARSLSHPLVRAVLTDQDGALWVGTRGGGLNRVDPKTGQVTVWQHDPDDPSSLPHDHVWALAEDQAGHIWVGTAGGGLGRLDPSTGRVVRHQHDPAHPTSLPTNRVYSIREDGTGVLWIGTVTAGLARYDGDGQFTTLPRAPDTTAGLSHPTVWPLLEDSAGALWIGTLGGGLNRYDPTEDTFGVYDVGDNNVTALAQTADGRLWVGTMSSGLMQFDPATQRRRAYTVAEGLPQSTVACLLPDEHGALWIGTSDGLARLDLDTETFTTFGVADGLPSALFHVGACHQTQEGELVFGTDAGVVRFFPEDIQQRTYEPPVHIVGLDLFNEPMVLDTLASQLRSVVLPHDSNFVAFQFAALDYEAPEQNAFAYQLEGLDERWVDARTQRRAGYPNLAPGTYRFRVRGTNSDGVWSSQEASLQLTITPPFWQRWWFRMLMLGAVAGVLLGAHRYRVHHLLKVERTRTRIAANLHDDLGSEMGNLA